MIQEKDNMIIRIKYSILIVLYAVLLGCSDDASQIKNNIVKYKIGKYDFDVPLYYHYGEYIKRKHKWPTPSRDRISVNAFLIDAILPEFQPWSSQNASEFVRLGWGNKTLIVIKKKRGRLKTLNEYISFLKNGRRLIKSNKPPRSDGLLHFIDRLSINNVNTERRVDIYVKKDPAPGNYFLIRCNRESKGKTSHPYCKIITDYDENIRVQYSFSKKHLDSWSTLEKNLREKINGFIINN